jgi:hypothetical protein
MTKQGLGATGQVLQTLSIVIGGKNTFGKTGEFKPLDIEYEVVNEEITRLIKSPHITIGVADLGQHYIDAFMRREPFILKGSIGDEGKDIPLMITISGQIHKMKNNIKVGDSIGREFNIRVDTYIERVDGEETMRWNRETMFLGYGGNSINVLENIAKNTL